MNVSEICNICKKASEQMLMLSCVHDPCIDCAASTFAEQVHIKHQNPNIYVCEICGDETALDSSTVGELNNLAKSYVRMPTSVKQTNLRTSHSHSKNASHQKSRSTQGATKKKQLQSLSPGKKGPIVYFCKEHAEEEISYYCFHCQSNICPECAIHGSHKDHDVKLIKKSIEDVKGEYLEVVSSISTYQNSMTKNKDSFLRQIKDLNDRYSREKNYVGKQFESVRNSIAAKQREILKNLELTNKENIQVLTGFLEEINRHYEEITKIKKSIELILRKDEVLIFEEYHNIKTFENNVSTIRKESESISGEVKALNTEYLQQEIKKLNDQILSLREGVRKEIVGCASSKSVVSDVHGNNHSSREQLDPI